MGYGKGSTLAHNGERCTQRWDMGHTMGDMEKGEGHAMRGDCMGYARGRELILQRGENECAHAQVQGTVIAANFLIATTHPLHTPSCTLPHTPPIHFTHTQTHTIMAIILL